MLNLTVRYSNSALTKKRQRPLMGFCHFSFSKYYMIVCVITLVKEFLDVNTVLVDKTLEQIHTDHKPLFAVN